MSARGGGDVLVLDVGSSSVRAWLYGSDARGIDPGPEAHRPYAWRTRPAGAMECDAEVMLARAVEAVDGAVAHLRASGRRVEAVACAALWHSIMGVDALGRPATPVYAWGDTRAAAEALRLRAELDEPAYHARTGCFLHPSYPLVKLAWLRSSEAEAYARVAAWMSFPEYLEWRLLGVRRCSYSMASGTGLFDVHRLRWDPAALDVAGIPEAALSPVVDVEAAPGPRGRYAARWPELAGVPWFPALGDGACANAGSGAVGAERAGLTIGTSAAVRALWEPEGPVEVPPGLWCYRLDGRRWTVGGALSNGGNAVAFLRQRLRLPGQRRLEASLAKMQPDAHGLTVLPFLMGERGPGWLSETRAATVGATPGTTPEQEVRAWLEGLAYRIGAVHARLRAALGGGGEVMASGGALHASPTWAQILADVLDRPLLLTVEREATARGAAAVALERLGRIRDLAALPVEVAVHYPPDPGRHARYASAAERQRALLEALAPWTRTAPLPAPDETEPGAGRVEPSPLDEG